MPFDGSYEPSHLIQTNTPGGRRGDYASKGLGEATFVDFDLGTPVRVAAFEHVQRQTPDTIAA